MAERLPGAVASLAPPFSPPTPSTSVMEVLGGWLRRDGEFKIYPSTAPKATRAISHGHTIHGAMAFAKLYPYCDEKLDVTNVEAGYEGRRRQVKTDVEIAASEAGEVSCFVCLSSEGPMLVNVCQCRWVRVHTACLDKLMQHDTTCRVCTTPFRHQPQENPFWSTFPTTAASSFLSSTITMISGVYILGWVALGPRDGVGSAVIFVWALIGPMLIWQGACTALILLELHPRDVLPPRILGLCLVALTIICVWLTIGFVVTQIWLVTDDSGVQAGQPRDARTGRVRNS